MSPGPIPVFGTGGYMLSVNDKLSNQDGIGLGRKGTINKPQYLNSPFWTVDTLFYLTSRDNNSLLFQYYVAQDINWLKFDESTGVPSLSKKTIENITKFIPTHDEQIKNGEFFKKLDRLITLHQRKINTLETFKKVYLSVMFTNKNDNTPLLRFKNFTEAWEQRELSQISNKVKEKNKDTIYTETLTNSAEYGIVPQTDYFDKEISNSKNISGYYIVRPNDFVYNPRISNFAPVGPIKRNKLSTIGIMSPLYYIFRPENIINDFLEKYFASNHWHRFMKQNGDSGARADRFAIKDKVFTEMPIPYPNIEEQKKVGIFLSNLDNVITLHQRKLYTLKKLKQAYLNKMFI